MFFVNNRIKLEINTNKTAIKKWKVNNTILWPMGYLGKKMREIRIYFKLNDNEITTYQICGMQLK